MTSFDQVRQKIRSNFPTSAIKPQFLKWNIETHSSLISSCNLYRISRRTDDAGVRTYYAYTVASATQVSKHVGGPFKEPDHAKDSAQRHFDYLNKELPL